VPRASSSASTSQFGVMFRRVGDVESCADLTMSCPATSERGNADATTRRLHHFARWLRSR
jgi:phage terminase Nu1 subunit (DNA packaging protein)